MPYARAHLARHTPELRAVFDCYASIGAGERSGVYAGACAQEWLRAEDALITARDARLCGEEEEGGLPVATVVALAVAARADQEPVGERDPTAALRLSFADFCELVARLGYAHMRRARAQRSGGEESGAPVLPSEGVADQAGEAHAAATRRFAHELHGWVGERFLAAVTPAMAERSDALAIRQMQERERRGSATAARSPDVHS